MDLWNAATGAVGGAVGGVSGACDEGKKNPAYGALCSGKQCKCEHCKQTVCHYHGPPNKDGTVGGHCGCKGPKCSVVVGGVTCGGKVSVCGDCKYTFCENHKAPGLENGVNGHACDIGCSTTEIYRKNCVGKKDQRISCKLCEKARSPQTMFCAYHAMPVASLIHTDDGHGNGGHVCRGWTSGSQLFGDSFGDLFALSCDMAVSVATLGTVNPAAATIAANAMQITIDKVFEEIGMNELEPVKDRLKAQIDKQAAKQKASNNRKLSEHQKEMDKKHGTNDNKENEGSGAFSAKELKQMAADLRKIAKLLKRFNAKASQFFDNNADKLEKAAVNAEAGKGALDRETQVALNAVQKVITLVDLAVELRNTSDAMRKGIKRRYTDPTKLIDAVKQCKTCYDKVDNATKVIGDGGTPVSDDEGHSKKKGKPGNRTRGLALEGSESSEEEEESEEVEFDIFSLFNCQSSRTICRTRGLNAESSSEEEEESEEESPKQNRCLLCL